MTSTAHAENERFYQEKYCMGDLEVRLADNTRIDCKTARHAIEYDFAKKWAEAIGQSLHYGRMSTKKPGIVLIVVTPSKDCKHVQRAKDNIKHFKLPIDIWTVGGDCL